jgi:hypothetical protein
MCLDGCRVKRMGTRYRDARVKPNMQEVGPATPQPLIVVLRSRIKSTPGLAATGFVGAILQAHLLRRQ